MVDFFSTYVSSRYHQKVPAEVPELESTEVGIATPVEFSLPSHNPRWKPEIFAAFDAGKAKPQVGFHWLIVELLTCSKVVICKENKIFLGRIC